MSGIFSNISKINNVKYKGINPKKKKTFIEETNKKIEDFNNFWKETMPTEIENKAEELLKIDVNGVKPLQRMLRKNGVNLSEKEIEAAIKSDDYEVKSPDAKVVSKNISKEYCTELKNFLNEVTKSTPKETLEEKTENVEEFFNDFSKDNPSEEIIEAADEKIGKLLAKEFRPLAEEKKSRTNSQRKAGNNYQREVRRKLIMLINKLLADIDRNDDMSNNDKNKSTSSLEKLKESVLKNDPSKLQTKDINILSKTANALAASSPQLKSEISKEQRQTKSGTTAEKSGSIINQFTQLAKTPTITTSKSIASSVERLSDQLNYNTKKTSKTEKPKVEKPKIVERKSETEIYEENLRNVRKNLKHVDHDHLWKDNDSTNTNSSKK